MMEGASKLSQSFMDVKGMPGAFKACRRFVVPVRGKDTTNTGFSMACRLNRGYKIQSKVSATLLTTKMSVNKGNMTQTWRTLCQRHARMLLPSKEKRRRMKSAMLIQKGTDGITC